ncbi:MAG: hypothetical protein M0Z31_10700 [Clostridia bacterium]|nr:hypothetical protein [Clostridia bacterium]
MDLVVIALMVIIMVVVVFLVGYPLIKPDRPAYRRALVDGADYLLTKDKESVMSTINEIEFDYQMNKLAEDDYRILKDKYKLMALNILKEEEDEALETVDIVNKGKKARVEDEIEQEIEAELARQKSQK